MKTYAKMIRYGLVGLAVCGALSVSGTQMSFAAQEEAKPKASTVSRGPRDPFQKYKPTVRSKKSVKITAPIAVPSIQERIERYKADKVSAMNAQRPAPKPTTAILLSEMQVTGIFRTPRGYAAMVEATPIKLSYVIYPGETFFDGQLVAIEEDRLVFRHETRWTDGRVVKAVENKPLRQANAVSDSLTVTRAATAGGTGVPANAPPSVEEKAPTPEKQ